MKKTLIAALLIALVALIQLNAAAQQIPYLSELLSRSEAFYKHYNEKRRAGANLSAIEPLRKRGEEAFRKGNIPGLVELMSEGMNVLQGKPWDDKQRFMASLTVETDRLVIEPNRELRVSLERIFPVNADKAFPSTPTVTFEVIPGENVNQQSTTPRLKGPVVIAERLAIAETSSNVSRRLLLPDGAYWVVARIESGDQKDRRNPPRALCHQRFQRQLDAILKDSCRHKKFDRCKCKSRRPACYDARVSNSATRSVEQESRRR